MLRMEQRIRPLMMSKCNHVTTILYILGMVPCHIRPTSRPHIDMCNVDGAQTDHGACHMCHMTWIMQHKIPLLLYMTCLSQDMIGDGADSVIDDECKLQDDDAN